MAWQQRTFFFVLILSEMLDPIVKIRTKKLEMTYKKNRGRDDNKHVGIMLVIHITFPFHNGKMREQIIIQIMLKY